jgi:hypothetical protein
MERQVRGWWAIPLQVFDGKHSTPSPCFYTGLSFPRHVAASSRYVVVQLNTPRNVYAVTRYDIYHSFKFSDIRGSAAARRKSRQV